MFSVLRTANFAEVLRGVCLVPASQSTGILASSSGGGAGISGLRMEGGALSFRLGRSVAERLEILDLSGRVLASHELGILAAGSHRIAVPSGNGLRIVRIEGGGESRSLKLAAF
jgi:hypothetical protein